MLNSSNSTESENTRRLRAALRVFMSPAIWMLVAYQVLLLSLARMDWQDFGDKVTSLYGPFIFSVLFVGFFFLAGGTYQSFAVSKSLVPLTEIVKNAKRVFASFLLLSIKVGLLSLLAINVVIAIVQSATGMSAEEILKTHAQLLPLIVGSLALVFVYWLPFVFVRGDFHLFRTLREALLLARAHLHQAGFLFLLILLPSLVLWWLPATTPTVLAIGVSAVGEVMAWVAYAYCVDFLRDQTGDDSVKI